MSDCCLYEFTESFLTFLKFHIIFIALDVLIVSLKLFISSQILVPFFSASPCFETQKRMNEFLCCAIFLERISV